MSDRKHRPAATAEQARLFEDEKRDVNWKRWGPYLSERQWGTVREDYSAGGSSWDFFPHDHARRRAYRWGEDGLQGWCDRQCRICFSLALWNEKDGILKERFFGLTGPEGNHGEDVKESYFYLESTPTHSYTKALYKYPQAAYPYVDLPKENRKRGRDQDEYELENTGIFQESRYFDVVQEVAKRGPEDLLWKITVTNHGPDAAPLHLLPTVWFRNTWRWHAERLPIPEMHYSGGGITLTHPDLGEYRFEARQVGETTEPNWLFTDNETDAASLFGMKNRSQYVKDGFDQFVVQGKEKAVNPAQKGTKGTPHFIAQIPAGESLTLECRLYHVESSNDTPFEFEDEMQRARSECDHFYQQLLPTGATAEEKRIARQGYAGLLWTKQFYHYEVDVWLRGDTASSPPPKTRLHGRNHDWAHFHAKDILSMPDKWEYPWFAAWDSAFHMIPFAIIDPHFAKSQLLLFLREWYLHPNGQIPAYEWHFSDVNPPVHAWAVWRVYKITGDHGNRDLDFLEKAFHKLLLNFTWWVNRKDVEGRHIFGGGFLGLDNIGVFDRSRELPGGGHLNQADGTAWMAFYSLTMLSIALELARHRQVYESIASKFFEHFVSISEAMNTNGGTGLWDPDDEFYYDQLIIDRGSPIPLKTRSLVGLLPLIANTVIDRPTLEALPKFRKRMNWFLEHNPHILERALYRHRTLGENDEPDHQGSLLLSVASRSQLEATLRRMLDEKEFLSDFGIRSLSKHHLAHPFVFKFQGEAHRVAYTPGESTTGMFGGNSNWRGPIWFPVNYLLIEALERYHFFFGRDFAVEFPTGSGEQKSLCTVADEICSRLISIFTPASDGKRPFLGEHFPHHQDPTWQNLVLFHEYFHGETGKGLGASHQTGWTALVVRLIRERREKLAKMSEHLSRANQGE